jgi:hypothetical protein
MRLKTLPLLAALIGSLTAAAAEPKVWRLDRTAQVGGQATEVLGAPRVIAEAGGAATWFNGASDGLLVPVNPLAGLAQFTVEVLFWPAADGPAEQRFLHVQDGPGTRVLIETRVANGTWALDTFLSHPATGAKLALLDPARRHPADRWTWVALVYDGRRMTHYIDGVKELEGEVAFPAMATGQVSLGVRQNKVYWFKGGIREVRWHATVLKAEELQR